MDILLKNSDEEYILSSAAPRAEGSGIKEVRVNNKFTFKITTIRIIIIS